MLHMVLVGAGLSTPEASEIKWKQHIFVSSTNAPYKTSYIYYGKILKQSSSLAFLEKPPKHT